MDAKPFYLSKVFWFNILAFAWQFVGPVLGIPILDDATFSSLVLVVNIVLRFITKGAISLS
jgi:hypothetical protein